jgi:ABC-type multidrug transport system fused ATPase/permease subunit
MGDVVRGERQRVALARAFLGRTAFLITHRLSALATCDARLQLERGRLVETAPTAALAYQAR